MSYLFDKPEKKVPLVGTEYVLIQLPDGKIYKIKSSYFLEQTLDLQVLGNSCLVYPTTIVTDCDGNQVTLPLQIDQVLLVHEQKLCEILANQASNTNCCDDNEIEIVLYNEFLGTPDEWNATETSGGVNIDLDSDTKPYKEAVSIEINQSDLLLDNEFILTNSSTVFLDNIKGIKFRMENESVTNSFKIEVSFYKGAVLVSQILTVSEGFYGFSKNNTGFKDIFIDFDQSIFTDIEFDNVHFKYISDDNTVLLKNIFVDYIRLVYKQTTQFDNIPPTVFASSDKVITLPIDSVTLNAVAYDSDGIVVSYLWEKVSGGNATIQNETFSSTNITDLEEGDYVFKITVTDNEGATASDVVFVTVLPVSANIAPISDAGADQLINLPTSSVNLNGSGFDPDGYIVSYLWEKISGGSATINNPNASTTSVTGLVEDVYVFRLTVTDNNGDTGTDEVTITVGDSANLVAVNIEIDLGDCDAPADWVGSESVYIADLVSVALGGDFNQQNGDVIYSENTLTTPFDGGDQLYSFRGVSPTFLTNNRVFRISSTGVISEMQECSAQDQAVAFNYDSSSNNPPDTYKVLTYAILATGYITNSGSPASKFKIKSLPTTGELGLMGNPVVLNQEIALSSINANRFAFWADLLNGMGAGGDYVDSFDFIIIDSEGRESNVVTLTLTATDIAVSQDATFYTPETNTSCFSYRCVKVTVPVGETREVTITKTGSAGYYGGSACGSSEVVLSNKTEIISATKIYSIGLDASTGSGNSSTTITVNVTGGNSVLLTRIHQDPVVNC